MITNLSRIPEPAELEKLRALVRDFDPDGRVTVEDGEVLVHGHLDGERLLRAAADAGIRITPTIAPGSECCGGCG